MCYEVRSQYRTSRMLTGAWFGMRPMSGAADESTPSSSLLLRGAPDYSIDTVSELTR